jgi:hypothetical protein
MPTMWFAKDGARPNSQRSAGIPITSQEAQVIAGLRELKYVGTEAPSINSDQPSRYERNVIFELPSSGEADTLMPNIGYYYVLGLKPEEARQALEAKRGEV